MSFMKLTVVTVNQFTLVNKTKDLSRIAIVILMKLLNTGKADYNFNWDQKKVIDRENRLIPRKIRQTIHSLKNPNHSNKISYRLLEIWLPNLR